MKDLFKQKNSTLKVLLTVIYICSFLISNILASKQFQLPFGITMTGAIIIFPITYILSDLFSEVYGYKWSRFTCYLGFAMNLLMVCLFQIAIITPAPEYWQNQEAFSIVLGSTPRILFASLLAFIIGDFINDKIFSKMKKKHNDMKGFTLRAFISSLCGELADSLIFIPLAFIGSMPAKTLVIMGITQVSLKVLYEVIILPLTKLLTHKTIKHEEKNEIN